MSETSCPLCGNVAGPGHSCPGTVEKMLGRLVDGRYRIESVIGQGGMGSVYRALQVSVQRPVAVKTLHPALAVSPRFFERFRREAELASKLRHPNIITVFDFGKSEDGLCYFAMELVDGLSLRQRVKQQGPLSLRRAVNVIEQAARGLAHAHAMGCVHRDLKPHNLMIQELEGREYVKVLDFGLVKALVPQPGEENLTATGQILGTPQYMPPEQAAGEDVDPRSDLYSLAAVFYFCLTGTSPYGANTVRKALTSANNQSVPLVSGKRTGAPVPRSVDEFLRKAMHRDRALRHQNAEEFIEDLLDSVADATDDELDGLPDGAELPAEQSKAPSRARANLRLDLPRRQTIENLRRPTAVPVPVAAPAVELPDKTVADHQPRPTRAETPARRRSSAPPAAETGTPKSSPSRRVLLVAPVLVLLAAGAAYFIRRSPPLEPTEADIEIIPRALERVAEIPPDAVVVALHSTPSGAQIFDGTLPLGQTPVSVPLARSRHALSFRLEGHETQERSVDLGAIAKDRQNIEVEVALPPAKARTREDRAARNKR